MKTHPVVPILRRSSVLLALSYTCLNFALVRIASAQQVPAESSTPAAENPRDKETVIELNPFVVDDTQDVGYLAGNSLAGSRLNQSLKDTAASISVLTPEFLSDIGATDMETALAYAVNVEMQYDDDNTAVNGNETVNEHQKYRVRGIPGSIGRNFSVVKIPTDLYNVDRIEESRGPNAVLFGIGAPGGLINASTKQPRAIRSVHTSLSAGSYDSWRGTLDVNQPSIDGRLRVRVNGVYDKSNTFRHYQFKESRRGQISASYLLFDKTRLRFEYERAVIEDNSPRTYNLKDIIVNWDAQGRPTFPTQRTDASKGIRRESTSAANPKVTYIGNSDRAISMRGAMRSTGTGGILTDPSLTDYSINFGGPDQNRYTRSNNLAGFFEHQFGRRAFLQLEYNHHDYDLESYDPRLQGNELRGDPNEFLNDGTPNPYAGQFYIEAGWFKVKSRRVSDTGRATFATLYDAKNWGKYRLTAFTEYEKAFIGNVTANEAWVDAVTGAPAFNPTPENAQNYIYRRTYVTPGDWASYYVNGANRDGLIVNATDPVTGRTLSSTWDFPRNNLRETYTTQKAYMLNGQARYFGDRLVLSAGLRIDRYNEFNVGRMRDPNSQIYILDRANPSTPVESEGRNRTLGAVYHIKPWVSVFYNQAENIELPPRGVFTFKPSGEPGLDNLISVSPPEGQGQDYGFLLDFADGKFFVRATRYSSAGTRFPAAMGNGLFRTPNERIMDTLLAENLITQSEHELRSHLASRGLYDRTAEGYELQVTANPTRNWRFQVNYSYTDAVNDKMHLEWIAWEALNREFVTKFDTTLVTDTGTTIAEELALIAENLREQTETDGLTKLGNRHHKVSLFTRYNFWGRLKGAYIGGGYRFQNKNFVGFDDAGGELYGNSYWRADFLAGYTVRGLRKGRTLNFQLNVTNLFNEHDPLIMRYLDRAPGVPDHQRRIHRLVVQSPITWRLTTKFGF